MNLEQGLMLGSLVSFGLQSSYKCWKKGKAKKFKAVKFGAIVMSKKTGKSQLCEALKGNDKVKLVDVGESVPREDGVNSEVNYLVEAKKYVENLRASLKGHSLLLVCSSIQEAQYLDVANECILVLTPCNKLFKANLRAINDDAERLKCEKERLELISACGHDLLNIFSSYDELYSVIKATFKLKSRF